MFIISIRALFYILPNVEFHADFGERGDNKATLRREAE